MSRESISAEREAMHLARKAVEMDEPDRLAWVLRCHRKFDVVERVLRLVLSFDGAAEELGVALVAPSVLGTMDLPLPARIDRFWITDLLGAGAFSRVYRAIDEVSGEPVALKVLHVQSDSDDATTRFQREIEVLAALRHPGIARFVDAGETRDERGTTRWIAIELVEGQSLREAAKGRDLRWVASAVARVGRAIQYAHDAGVIHRDLKPSNVMVTDRGVVKVLDFGVAAIRNRGERSRLTTTGQVVGTIAYMPPEQVAGHPASISSDQFSLAAMLFEGATGKLPHSDGSDGLLGLFSIAGWDGSIDPSLLKSLPSDLATILERALDPDPALRYESTLALAEELDRWAEGKQIRTARAGWAQRTRRFVRRNRKPVAAGAAAIVVLASALVLTVPALASARAESARAQAFGDQARLPLLLSQVDGMWPQTPEMVPRLDRWLSMAEAVLARRDSSEKELSDDEELATFRAQLGDLPVAIEVIRERRTKASTLVKRTVDDHASAWFAAAERVHADPRFRGLALLPQVGLIPLGPDPRSGLEEFAVADWGSLPSRDGRTRELVREEDFAPVLVLLPGGRMKFGTAPIPREDWYLHGSNRMAFATQAEFGLRDVDLDPFLIGKFEVTQAQWKMITGENPSEWRAGEPNYGIITTLLHPVETIGFAEAKEAARRIGCTLPTEAQWQCGAAPMERGLFWWSEDNVGPEPLENLIIRSSVANAKRPWADDPFEVHAPVGSFHPNPNGLYDVLGNVQERCLDEFKVAALRDLSLPLAQGTGEVRADGGGDRSCRGGHFHNGFYENTLARRYGPPDRTRIGGLGARFARTLTR